MKRFVLAALCTLLTGCGESSGIPESGPIVITYQARDSWVDSVMSRAEKRLQVLSREVQLRPGEPYALEVEISEDGWSEGRAKLCSIKPGSGWVKINQFNHLGDRTELAIVFVMHEVGHMLGAKHKEGRNVMHEASGGLVPLETLGFLDESVSEMERCTNGITTTRKAHEHGTSDRRVF